MFAMNHKNDKQLRSQNETVSKRLWLKQTVTLGFLSMLTLSYMNCSSKGFQAQLTSTGSQSSASSGSGSSGSDSSGTTVVTIPTPLPVGQKDVFMAFGKVARTVMSCDDGATWINDQSDDPAAQCWTGTADTNPHYVECDHDARSSVGLDSGTDGWFYAQYGWGYDGTIRRTRNGVNWQVVRTAGWGGGLAVAKNILFTLWGSLWSYSKDNGTTWQNATTIPSVSFDHPFVKHVGDKLITSGRQNGDMAVSLDSGVTWTRAPEFEAGWGDSFAEGNGMIVSTGTRLDATNQPVTGFAARSLDNGKTWSAVGVFASKSWSANIIFDGKYFVNWADGKKWSSADGVAWTSVPFTTGSINPQYWGATVAYNSRTGTYTAITSSWGAWYSSQRAFRSSDGITFKELDGLHFKGGHPIVKLILGQMDSASCPVQ